MRQRRNGGGGLVLIITPRTDVGGRCSHPPSSCFASSWNNATLSLAESSRASSSDKERQTRGVDRHSCVTSSPASHRIIGSVLSQGEVAPANQQPRGPPPGRPDGPLTAGSDKLGFPCACLRHLPGSMTGSCCTSSRLETRDSRTSPRTLAPPSGSPERKPHARREISKALRRANTGQNVG
jgi:hypothetical protein